MKEITYWVKVVARSSLTELARRLERHCEVKELIEAGEDEPRPDRRMKPIPPPPEQAFLVSAQNGKGLKVFPGLPTPRVLSEAGRAAYRAGARKRVAAEHERKIATLATVLRANAHAPLSKIARLMDDTGVRPLWGKSAQAPWSELLVQRYLDEALARITAPDAPPLIG